MEGGTCYKVKSDGTKGDAMTDYWDNDAHRCTSDDDAKE